ncbi:hypothetical protein KIS4809_0537 [Bacillus sp. ZZV12-4809]|nr:hypothetical protein KIS4809_0537 [Bacillus sp. ZZV12-4809]
MHWRKYFILLIPALVIFIASAFIIPYNKFYLIYIIPFTFWVIYYSWLYIEKRKKRQ